MSVQEAKAAYDAGRAAFARGETPAANPYRPAKVHPLEQIDPHQQVLAAVWLRGWQKDRPEVNP